MTRKSHYQRVLDYEVSSRTPKGVAVNFGLMFGAITVIIFAIALVAMGILSFVFWSPYFFFPWWGIRTVLAIAAVLGVWFAIDMARE